MVMKLLGIHSHQERNLRPKLKPHFKLCHISFVKLLARTIIDTDKLMHNQIVR